MSGLKDGGPARPMKTVDAMGNEFYGAGISLRDWFAGQALMAMELRDDGKRPSHGTSPEFKWVASAAYKYADAMLAARSGTSL